MCTGHFDTDIFPLPSFSSFLWPASSAASSSERRRLHSTWPAHPSAVLHPGGEERQTPNPLAQWVQGTKHHMAHFSASAAVEFQEAAAIETHTVGLHSACRNSVHVRQAGSLMHAAPGAPDMLSAAMMREPMAAWIGTLNCCRGMSSLSLFTRLLPIL
jgi:hypothetical protein